MIWSPFWEPPLHDQPLGLGRARQARGRCAEALERGVPLWKLLGGARRHIECGVSLGIQDTVEQLLDKIALELDAGYRRIKVKVKPGWDVAVLERIRSRWPDILLSCDANSAYTLDDFDHLRQFDRFHLLMIEQPLWNDDFYFHARLQKQLKTALCLDESIRHARDAETVRGRNARSAAARLHRGRFAVRGARHAGQA